MIGLADCNNFFCSCERVFHPELVGRPVVVLSNNDGCIIARSNESKALGLTMGTPFYQVREFLEHSGVAVFSSNYTLYGDMSARVMSLLRRYCPHIDIYSIDEAFLDLRGMGDSERLGEYCRDMVRVIARGTGIPISIGVAPTKTLAKLASKFAKKYPGYRGVCIIDTDYKRQRALELTPVDDVWGIGRRHTARLQSMGIKTALDFARLSPTVVQRLFHVTGLRTWRELRGESCVSIDELPRKKSICTSRTFPESGLSRRADVEEAIANFAAQCVRKLRQQHSAARAMTVFAHTSPFRPDLPQHTIYATATMDVATSCLGEVVATAVNTLRSRWVSGADFKYKKAGVIVWDICADDAVQMSLFEPSQRRQNVRSVQRAIDAVNRHLGHNTVHTAVQGGSKRWHLKTEYLTRQYTTNLAQVLTVNCPSPSPI